LSLKQEKLGGSDFEKLEDVNIENICCKFCEEQFFTSANLELHVKRHHRNEKGASENQPVKTVKKTCLFCEKVFSKSSFYRHMRSSHKKCEGVRCKFTSCGAVFTNGEKLKKHLEKKHKMEGKKPIECELCQIWFSTKRTLERHFKNTQIQQEKLYRAYFVLRRVLKII